MIFSAPRLRSGTPKVWCLSGVEDIRIKIIMSLHDEILTPSQALFKGDADEVVAPSVNGEVGLLPQHTEYLTLLQAGALSVRQADQTKTFDITGGLLTVAQDYVTVLVDGVLLPSTS